jgi:hypothetical protein
MNAMKPKYTISGDSLEEMALSFAELVCKAGTVEVVEKDKTKFAVWKLDDGSSDSPIYKSFGLDDESAALFNRQYGAPLAVAVDVRYLLLTPLHAIGATIASKKAATIQRITKRLDSVENLKAQLARLQQS